LSHGYEKDWQQAEPKTAQAKDFEEAVHGADLGAYSEWVL
jgi:hypothetical protein